MTLTSALFACIYNQYMTASSWQTFVESRRMTYPAMYALFLTCYFVQHCDVLNDCTVM